MSEFPEIDPPWPLTHRHLRLPKWAQNEIHALLCEQINVEMRDCVMADVRELAKKVTGGNCTFSDDDVRLLAHLALRACDADLLDGLDDERTKLQIRRAAGKRRRAAQGIVTGTAETRTGSTEGDSPVAEGHAPGDSQ